MHRKTAQHPNTNSQEAIRKARETKIRNGHLERSKSEDDFYHKLLLIGFNKEAALGRIYENRKEYEKALKCYTDNVSQFQRQLIHSIVLCGNMHNLNGEKKQASKVYSLAITLSENFLENNPIPENKSLQKNLTKTIERCRKTIEQLSK